MCICISYHKNKGTPAGDDGRQQQKCVRIDISYQHTGKQKKRFFGHLSVYDIQRYKTHILERGDSLGHNDSQSQGFAEGRDVPDGHDAGQLSVALWYDTPGVPVHRGGKGTGAGGQGGRGACSFVTCLRHLTIDHVCTPFDNGHRSYS